MFNSDAAVSNECFFWSSKKALSNFSRISGTLGNSSPMFRNCWKKSFHNGPSHHLQKNNYRAEHHLDTRWYLPRSGSVVGSADISDPARHDTTRPGPARPDPPRFSRMQNCRRLLLPGSPECRTVVNFCFLVLQNVELSSTFASWFSRM